MQIGTKNKLGEGLSFKISRFKEEIKRTNPHKHDGYYELIFLSEGEGFHSIEAEKYLVSPPEFYCLKPGQLHFWEFTSVPKGFVILFRDAEFDQLQESGLIELYKRLGDTTRLAIPVESYPEPVLSEMLLAFNQNTPYSRLIIHGLLSALLGKLLYLSDCNPLTRNPAPSLYARFRQLLTRECPQLHKVNQFAELLNTTPQSLNAICRKQANKSASEMIASQLLLEAKRYVLHTDNTVNEIADILLFSDPSNFIKFFKKATGVTPVQFRGQYFQ